MKLEPDKPVTVAFLLSDESAASLRVVVQDPATDAELYRSPSDIPVRLGVLDHEQRSSPRHEMRSTTRRTACSPGKVVRKDLVRKVKVGANVPVFVLEFLLGKYCASSDEVAIQMGLQVVNDTLANNYIRSDESMKAQARSRTAGVTPSSTR